MGSAVETGQGLAPNQKPLPRSATGAKWFLLLTAVLSSISFFALDNTIVADVQPKIVDSLGEINKLTWISVGFALGAVVVQLFWGKVFTQMDTKRSLLVAVVLFETGSAVCGAAPTMNALIVGRTLCGVGGVGIYVGAINIISFSTTEAERPGCLGFVGLTWGIGTVLGPIISGAFAGSSATWRWRFYISLCVGGAAAPIYLWLIVPHDPRPGVPVKEKLRILDLPGAVLNAGFLVSGIMAISFGGTVYPWYSSKIIGLFVCSGVLFILFALQQVFLIIPETRLFPREFLRSYEQIILFTLIAASVACAFVPVCFIPLYFQFVFGDSAIAAGVHLLPFACIMVFAVISNGILMGVLGYYMPWYLSGRILVVIGSALMHTVQLDTSVSRIYGYSVILALGTGLFSQASFPVSQAKITGIALSLTISNSVFLNQATAKIARIMPEASLPEIQQAISSAGGPFFSSLSSEQQTAAQKALVSTIGNLYYMLVAAGALTIVLSLFLKREKLFVQKAPEHPEAALSEPDAIREMSSSDAVSEKPAESPK
ncbi:putative MFS drug efflux transporter [Aspergillus ellipticus CBS 707.79]|uniref:Putative MFS drug efflux transporter n=1 Tax=Aspergillus ellipticus CBS 707.79 TaxID=1448320 RepID=A0A319DAA5_9EURO|nr:putative MFS drug efflux transporter [Aspergillus ellipticus CBS 707.79]